MINNFKKPDLNAPRYREKVFGLLNADLINEFKEKNPIYSKIDNSKFKKIIKLFNERVWNEVIENRDGIELPDSLGYLFIGTCPAAKSVNTDYALSKQYGKVLKIESCGSLLQLDNLKEQLLKLILRSGKNIFR